MFETIEPGRTVSAVLLGRRLLRRLGRRLAVLEDRADLVAREVVEREEVDLRRIEPALAPETSVPCDIDV